MLIYENKKARLLNFIYMGLIPFQKFVSTGEIREPLGLVNSRDELFNKIKQIIQTDENLILPIIAGSGIGKTHLFWELKKKLYYHNTFYVSLENVYRRFYYNLYSELIEEMGVEVIRSITNKLCNVWGANERRFGFFQVVDIDKIRENAYNLFEKEFDDKVALTDAINAITAHQLDPYKKREAERWLLGELMDIKELSRLNIMRDLRSKHYSYSMLKILIENSKLGTLLFIDDFERIISLLGESGTMEEQIYDPSYLFDEAASPETVAAQKTLNKILKLQKIKSLKLIITLKSLDSFEEIKKKIMDIDEKLLNNFKEPLYMTGFTEVDVNQFYKDTMNNYITETIKYPEFLDDHLNSYFPLNQDVLKYVYAKTNGNPRALIKLLMRIFNEIANSNEDLNYILQNYT